MSKLFQNIKHLPSTIAGGVVAGGGFILPLIDPSTTVGATVQQIAAGHPKVAAGVGLLAGLALIFGVGPKKQ